MNDDNLSEILARYDQALTAINDVVILGHAHDGSYDWELPLIRALINSVHDIPYLHDQLKRQIAMTEKLTGKLNAQLPIIIKVEVEIPDLDTILTEGGFIPTHMWTKNRRTAIESVLNNTFHSIMQKYDHAVANAPTTAP